ncbi:type IV pili methyl-accepting chemotaxis transducer N-terminal domain-containing protein [bacterium]|nr:type IV pili methyl-accepting chemotaxis transducer N-terminal domain-containing protein [bacterium]
MSQILRFRPAVAGLSLAVLVLTLLGTPLIVAAAEGPTAAEYGVVLNLSGKQRMLSQKMSKEIMLVAMDVDKAANLKNLAATAALFDKTLHGLRDGDADLRLPPTTNARILRQLDTIGEIWTGFHATVDAIVAAGAVTPDQVAEVAAANLPLLQQMNKCVKLYEKDASSAGLSADPGLAVTINLAGKQRMLTQKMSKEYLLVAYGHETDANKLNLLETYTLFERTLAGLKDGDDVLGLPATSNADIRAQLDVVAGLWATFKPVVENGAAPGTTAFSATDLQTLATTNLPLLKEMNAAVGMYEKEAGGGGASM